MGLERLTAKGYSGTFWGDGSFLYLDWGGIYIGIYINQYIWMYDFIICTLYINKLINRYELKTKINFSDV